MLISQILSGIVAVYVIVPNSNSDYPHSHFFDLYDLTFTANITLRRDGIWNLAQTPPLRSVMFVVNTTTRKI